MPAERRTQILAVVLAALVAAGVWRVMAGDTTVVSSAAPAKRAAPEDQLQPPVDVSLDALEGNRRGPDDSGRNPFVFGLRQVTVTDDGARRPVTRRPAVPETAPVLLPPGPPPLPPIPFKFIGLVEGTAGTKKIAVLSDSKGLVVHGSEGTIIDGRFRILSIGTESLDIAYADGRGRQTLRLTGQ